VYFNRLATALAVQHFAFGFTGQCLASNHQAGMVSTTLLIGCSVVRLLLSS
jgi:hypothetical protein